MRIIAVAMTKGGVGKTTTAVNLSHGLARRGHRVLLVDTDTQGQCAKALGVETELTITEVLLGEADLLDAVTRARENLDVVAADHHLTRAALAIARRDKDGHRALAEALERVIGLVGEVRPAEPEPMLNLFAAYAEGRWISWLFPRAAHRPGVYGHGPDDYLISPGGVDLAGVLIAPRPGDCDRLEAATIESILSEVLLSPGAFARLRDRLVDQTPA